MALFESLPTKNTLDFLNKFSTFSGLLMSRQRERPDAPAVIFSDSYCSWNWLATAVNGIRQLLERRGAKRGDRIAVHLSDGPFQVASIISIESCGALYMPVNPKLPADQKARILAFARANFLLQDDAVDGPIRQSGYSSAEEWDRLTLSHLPRRPDHEEPSTRFGSTGPHRLQEDFAIAISSATTGAAKAIIINQFSPLATGHAMAAALRISADDGILPMVPLTSHLNLCCSIPASLVSGAPLLIPAPKQKIDKVLPWAITHGEILFVGVPTNYIQMLQAFGGQDGLKGRRGIVAGSVCDSQVLRAVRNQLGVTVCNHYGMSEFGGISTVHIDDSCDEIVYSSTGLPFPWVEVRSDGDTASPGEILVRGPGRFRTSLTNLEEMEKRVTKDGWLHTGDYGLVGKHGEVRVVGRAGDMAIRCGNNVFFAEIESALRDSTDIADVVAFSLPDREMGEALCACIVPAAGANPSPSEIFAFAADRLAHFKMPDFVAFHSSIATNLNGKVLRKEIQSHALAGSLKLWPRTARKES